MAMSGKQNNRRSPLRCAGLLCWGFGQAQLEPTEASVLAMLLPAVCTF
jgi:hypothetical protein